MLIKGSTTLGMIRDVDICIYDFMDIITDEHLVQVGDYNTCRGTIPVVVHLHAVAHLQVQSVNVTGTTFGGRRRTLNQGHLL